MRMLFAFVLRENANCIDIGAHTGAILREMERCAPQGRHYAFEPIPEFYERLLLDFPGVTISRAAVSSTSGTATFKYVRTAPGYSGLLSRTYPRGAKTEDILVPVVSLDDFLPPDYAPDLIKIDVEGAEHLVLAGAERLIRACRPIVVFEHGFGGQAPPGDVYAFFARAKFRIFDLDGHGPYDKATFLREYHVHKRHWNWVAHP